MMSRRIAEYVLHAAYIAGATNSQGDVVDSWGTASSVGVYGFDPGSTTEAREVAGERVVTVPTLYMPASVVFGPRDRVTARGKVYEVEGETREWRHPGGLQKGNVVTLRRVEG